MTVLPGFLRWFISYHAKEKHKDHPPTAAAISHWTPPRSPAKPHWTQVKCCVPPVYTQRNLQCIKLVLSSTLPVMGKDLRRKKTDSACKYLFVQVTPPADIQLLSLRGSLEHQGLVGRADEVGQRSFVNGLVDLVKSVV